MFLCQSFYDFYNFLTGTLVVPQIVISSTRNITKKEIEMETKLCFVQTVNRLIDSDHIIICGHPVFVECQRVRKLATDGAHLWAIGVSGACTQVPATCVTDAWFYDLTDGKTIYGTIPVSNFSSKSSPAQEIV